MKQLFTPELGTELKLAEDWTFTLYAESRNETLANLYNLTYFYFNNWITLELNESKPDNKNKWIEATRESHSWTTWIYDENENGNYTNGYYKLNPIYKKAYEEWKTECQKVGVNNIQVTIPKDSTLIVDRIYIRKGKEKFSSISFYWKDKPLDKGFKKYVRFWCKLEDANKIKFK